MKRKPSYLIEFRFQGKAKKRIKQMIREINTKCRIRPPRRPVPHISIAGPFTTNNEKRLISDFNKLCSSTPLMKFRVTGFDVFKDNRVVFIDISPSEKLDEFRWELSKTIAPYCKLKDFDYKRKFEFHATLAYKLDMIKFEKVKQYIKRKKEPHFRHIVVRVTIIKNSKILREYDFILRRLLTRKDAKSKTIYRQTIYKLNRFFEGKYDPNKNIIYEEKKSVFDKIKSLFR